MNAHRMDQETVERLLVGPVSDPQDGTEVLVRLLAAVRAAPHPHEFGGEAAALQAFRAARAGTAPLPAARPGRRRPRLLGARLALAGLLAAGSGGVALAAVTGTLPGLPGRVEPSVAPRVSGAGGPDSPAPSRDPSPAPAGRPTGSPDRPTAALTGLCTAYLAAPAADRRQALGTPPFADLVAAAGGPDRVDDYCDRLVDRPPTPTGDPSKRPTPTARPQHTRTVPAVPATPPVRPDEPTANRPATVGPPQR
ncbi:hypothetical protein [Micromonospora sp. NPDC050495]|uniref:hypothetical protein n=1 Tax=Micromonospora sp. NPDC050495 TaxID=3154936 RepID=UPI00341158E8